jgi:hypothetical protein
LARANFKNSLFALKKIDIALFCRATFSILCQKSISSRGLAPIPQVAAVIRQFQQKKAVSPRAMEASEIMDILLALGINEAALIRKMAESGKTFYST